ncbi:serine/threonine-protein kinase [Marinicella meishanensis]|uniref:serine/threonine-protein kinase n=1 Tax=Marinicella meishanensis TaxID=2873263 RepID=UPI001CBCD5C6|nr:serine/threonine-protein kinase [Marinicella sp. NBU2979]
MDPNQAKIWQQACDIFLQLADLPTAEALAQVAAMDDLDAAVKASVINLIQAEEQDGGYLEDRLMSDTQQAIRNRYQAGDRLNEYELLEPLGEGGMSQVFKAKRLGEDVQKWVAIKVLSPQGKEADELLHQFVKEQEILAGLSHPNIVDMLHGGQTENHDVFLVMELIEEAMPITAHCQQQGGTVRERMRLILQCAQALSYSHANLIIHRDLKPDNILIDRNEVLKIVDFGIAKLIDQKIQANKTTILALTPNYASPEQINAQAVSVTTDVFSLAVVALELLVGQPPLPRDRLLKSCAHDELAVDQHLKALRVDGDLKNILRTALQNEPERRYPSMYAFAEDLQHWLDNKPVNASPQSFGYRLKKYAIRKPAVVTAVVAGVLLLCSALSVTLYKNQQIQAEAQKAAVVKQFMLDAFENTNPDVNQGATVTANDLLQAAALRLQADRRMDQAIKFDLLQSMGIAFGKLGLYQQAIDHLQQSLQLQPNEPRSMAHLLQFLYDSQNFDRLEGWLQRPDIFAHDSLSDLAKMYRVKSRFLARQMQYDQALLAADQALQLPFTNNQGIEYVLSQKLLAEIHFFQSNPQQSVAILTRLLADSAMDHNQRLFFEIRKDLSEYHLELGAYEDAMAVLEQLLIDQRRVLGDDHPDLLETLRVSSATLKDLGLIDQAMEKSTQAHAISLKHFGADSIQTGYVLNNLATIAYAQRDLDRSEALLAEAVAIFEAKLPPNYSDTLELKSNHAAVLKVQKKFTEALAVTKQVLESQRISLGPYHDQTLYTQKLYAEILAKIKHTEAAFAEIESTVALAREHLPAFHPMTSEILYAQGVIYQEAAVYPQAKLAFHHSIDNEKTESPVVRKAAARLALVNIELGDFVAAQEHILRALRLGQAMLGEAHPITVRYHIILLEILLQSKPHDFALMQTHMDALAQLMQAQDYAAELVDQQQQVIDQIKALPRTP